MTDDARLSDGAAGDPAVRGDAPLGPGVRGRHADLEAADIRSTRDRLVLFRGCALCGSPSIVELPTKWQIDVAGGYIIPIVGCGNPWHYINGDTGFRMAAATDLSRDAEVARLTAIDKWAANLPATREEFIEQLTDRGYANLLTALQAPTTPAEDAATADPTAGPSADDTSAVGRSHGGSDDRP